MMKKFTLILLIVTLITSSSCLRSLLCIRGDGEKITQRRRVTSFNEIANETSFDVIHKLSDTTGLSIEGEQNILHYIETNVYDGCLEISVSPGSICLDYNIRPVITVSSPHLEAVINSGSGDIIAGQVDGNFIKVKLTGSGDVNIDLAEGSSTEVILSGSGNLNIDQMLTGTIDVTLTGSGDMSTAGNCDDAHLKITGSGNIRGRYLETNTASIIISGSGSTYLNVSGYLNALISGSGNIYLTGDPQIDQTITGSGRIIQYR